MAWLLDCAKRIDSDLISYFDRLSERLSRQATHPVFTDNEHMLRSRLLSLEHSQQRLLLAGDNLTTPFAAAISRLAAQLQALSPIQVLARGYALATGADGRLIRRVSNTEPGANLTVRLVDGSLVTEVRAVIPESMQTAFNYPEQTIPADADINPDGPTIHS